MGFSMYVLLSENIAFCCFLILGFSITPEPNVTVHDIFVCMCELIWMCIRPVSGHDCLVCKYECVCVCARLFFVCTHIWKAIFCGVTWMHMWEKGYTHPRKLPLFLSLKWKWLRLWCSGRQRIAGIRPPWETRQPYTMKMTSRVDWLGGTCFQYATLCKRYIWEISCQEKATHEAPFHPAEISLTFKKKQRVCLLLRFIYRYLLWFIYHFLCMFLEYLFTLIYS